MKILTTKEYLELAYRIDKVIQRRRELAAKHRDSLYGRSIDYSNSGGSGGGNDALGRAVASVRDYEAETDKIISILVSIRFEIESSINGISDKMQKEVLTDRYLLYMPWKNRYDKDTGKLLEQGIKEKMGYSAEAVYKFHSEGLKNISVPEKITVKYSEIQYWL